MDTSFHIQFTCRTCLCTKQDKSRGYENKLIWCLYKFCYTTIITTHDGNHSRGIQHRPPWNSWLVFTPLHFGTSFNFREKRALKNYGSLYLACNDRKAFFTSSEQSRYTLWSCQNVCDALSYLLDNIYIRFGTKLYRQIVGIPMGTNCAPLVADLFLYCYERDFMDSLNHDNQADVIEAFNSTSRYLDDLLNIDNPYFEGMVNQIYPSELQLNKANISDTEAPFLDLHLFVANRFVSSKIYDKRDDFDFDIVNFPFLDGDVPRRASYGVYISQLIRFARVCNHVTDFNARNKC